MSYISYLVLFYRPSSPAKTSAIFSRVISLRRQEYLLSSYHHPEPTHEWYRASKVSVELECQSTL